VRIAINTSCVVAGGGITHLRHLVPRLLPQLGEDRLFLIGGPEARDRLGLAESVEWVAPAREPAGLLRRVVWENTELPAILRREGADVVFHPANFGLFRSPVPVVSVVHNLAPFLSAVKSGESLGQRVRLEILRRLTWRGLAASDTTIFISNWGKELVLRDFGAEPPRAPVIAFGGEHLNPVQADSVLERLSLEPGRYILSVSQLYRYKCVEHLIDAHARLGDRVRNVPLVIVGAPYDRAYARALEERCHRKGVDARFTGELPAEEVAALMAHCLALGFTSEAENLPLTLLEAMALGCPIVTNRSCSMPEVCGDAVLYARDATGEGYASEIERLLEREDLRVELIARARERAAGFSWETAADETLRVLRAAAKRGNSGSNVSVGGS
jgi:glycosyltransferase involved in cell wall biosynthesis